MKNESLKLETVPPFDPGELERLRADTPGCAKVIHLNNAGAALMPRRVVETIHAHLDLESQIGGYEAADLRAEAIGGVYEALARMLGTRPGNVALVENATAAYAQALSSIPWREGDVILTSNCDYVSNQLMFFSLRDRFGVRLVRAADRPTGGVDPDDVAALIRKHHPRLVAITHIPTNSGLVQEVESIGELCADAGILYLVDACQSVGQMPLETQKLRCDFLTASSRKFLRGPRGTGFLYVSDRVLEEGLSPLFPDLRGADWSSSDGYDPAMTARRFENFEYAFANILGMGEAARYALEVGLDRIECRARSLASLCRQRLGELNQARILDEGDPLAAIVTVDLAGTDLAGIVTQLRAKGINTSRSPRNFALLDFERKGATEGALRISPHYYNTETEVETCVEILGTLL